MSGMGVRGGMSAAPSRTRALHVRDQAMAWAAAPRVHVPTVMRENVASTLELEAPKLARLVQDWMRADLTLGTVAFSYDF